MKLQLVYINGNVVGYTYIAETKQESEALTQIQQLLESGKDKTVIVYDGVETETATDEKISSISFIQQRYSPTDTNYRCSINACKSTKTINNTPPTAYECPNCNGRFIWVKQWVASTGNGIWENTIITQTNQNQCFCTECEKKVSLEPIKE